MWADAQSDGRPAEYRWRCLQKFHNSIPCITPLFGWRPLLECRAVTLPILENAKLGRKVNFAHDKLPLGDKSPRKCIYSYYSVRAQETTKHRAKFGWPLLCHVGAVTLPRRETRWNLLGCPKLPNISQPLVGRRSPYCEDIWRRYCCLTFFPIVDTCLSCKDIARQLGAMVRRWRFFAQLLRPVFSPNRVQHISDLHSKFALRPHHVWKYGRHIQSATAKIRREKKKKERKKKKIETTAAKYNGLPHGRP